MQVSFSTLGIHAAGNGAARRFQFPRSLSPTFRNWNAASRFVEHAGHGGQRKQPLGHFKRAGRPRRQRFGIEVTLPVSEVASGAHYGRRSWADQLGQQRKRSTFSRLATKPRSTNFSKFEPGSTMVSVTFDASPWRPCRRGRTLAGAGS